MSQARLPAAYQIDQKTAIMSLACREPFASHPNSQLSADKQPSVITYQSMNWHQTSEGYAKIHMETEPGNHLMDN
jgi:hypothetical protein